VCVCARACMRVHDRVGVNQEFTALCTKMYTSVYITCIHPCRSVYIFTPLMSMCNVCVPVSFCTHVCVCVVIINGNLLFVIYLNILCVCVFCCFFSVFCAHFLCLSDMCVNVTLCDAFEAVEFFFHCHFCATFFIFKLFLCCIIFFVVDNNTVGQVFSVKKKQAFFF
jgi:hypothetical protein